jgi:hypothetical protein
MAIECCNGCVAPKRYPGCQDHCPDYIIDNAFHQVEKAERSKKVAMECGLYQQRYEAIRKTAGKRRSGGSLRARKIE